MKDIKMETNDKRSKRKIFDMTSAIEIKTSHRIIATIFMFVSTAVSIVMFELMDKNAMPMNISFSYALSLAGMVVLFMIGVAFALDTSPIDKSSLWFFVLIISVFIGCFTDASSVILDGDKDHILLNKILTFICCLISPVSCFSLCVYQYALHGKKKKEFNIYLSIMFIFGILDVIFFIFNLFFGYVYVIDKGGHYVSGNLRLMFLVYPASALLSSMFVSHRVFGFEQKKISILLIISIMAILGCSIFTSDDYSYSYFVFSIVIFLMYTSIQTNRGKEIAKKNEMIARQSMDLIKKEQQIMISQINPHFIYNTLSTIECLCETDPMLAASTVHNFSNYLRTNVDTLTKVETVPIEKELEHVRYYVAIETLRFPNINVEYDIKDTDFMIPTLTIQPMVENAIRYGVRMRDSGLIRISSYFQDMTHYIEIEDNGCGFDVNAPMKQDERGHVGIENVRSRLEKMVNGNLCIISKTDVGTKAIISIPQRKEDD